MEGTKSARELAGHEAQILTTGVGVPRSTWTAHLSVLGRSASGINANVRADPGFLIYAGKTSQKRTELLALFASFGIPVAPASVVARVAIERGKTVTLAIRLKALSNLPCRATTPPRFRGSIKRRCERAVTPRRVVRARVGFGAAGPYSGI